MRRIGLAQGRFWRDIWLPFGVGLVYTAWITIRYVVLGSQAYGGDQPSYWSLALAYPLTGLAAGVVTAYVRPFAVGVVRRLFASILVSVPAGIGIVIGFYGVPWRWGGRELFTAMFIAGGVTVAVIQFLFTPGLDSKTKE